MKLPTYEVYAIKYAERTDVRRPANFVGGDPHDGPMPLDYYLWLIRDDERVFVVDTGFDAKVAAKRQRAFVREPRLGLAALKVETHTVRDVIITHMHNDHAGTFYDFPSAAIHIQDKEMAYATGRYMTNHTFARPYELDHVLGLVKLVYENRVVFHDGDEEIARGVEVHHIGGHTAGLQAVRVHTKRGWMVLASDASHYYENIESRRCFPTVFNLGEMADGYAKINRLAESPKHIIPGHDPLVLQRYPAAIRGVPGIARVDAEPLS